MKKIKKIIKVVRKEKVSDKTKVKPFYIAERKGSRFNELYTRLKDGQIKLNRVYDLTRDKIGNTSFDTILSSKACIPYNRDTHKALRSKGYDLTEIKSFNRGTRKFLTSVKFIKVKR